MKSILIISTNTRVEERLRSYVTEEGIAEEYSFETTASFGQGESWWVTEGPDLLVIMMPDDLVLQSFFIKKMTRDIPRNLPVVFVAGEVSASFLQLSSMFRKMRALKSPVTPDNLFRTLYELLLIRPPKKQQRHQRYAVDIKARMRLEDGSSQVFPVEVKNLSLGGAFLEISSTGGQLPEVGQMLNVEIVSSENEVQHSFAAEVIWHKESEGVGIKFVNNEKAMYDLAQPEED